MQIKKGPYGYYAIEKLDSPDKICAYAEEVIAGTNQTSIFSLLPIFSVQQRCVVLNSQVIYNSQTRSFPYFLRERKPPHTKKIIRT